MKIVQIETLISEGDFPKSEEWGRIRLGLHEAVAAVDWPPGSGKFIIYPQSGKKRGEGNGVKPIKNECIRRLKALGWKEEEPLNVATNLRPGDLDAVFYSTAGPVAMEWETGNVSSSHRALNKMAVGLMAGLLVGASLVVPSRKLYKWLTDRIGNFPELAPYLDLWRAVPCSNGVLEIVVIEQDGESLDVPRIPKGTDGRSQN
jgi:hypothetical protein